MTHIRGNVHDTARVRGFGWKADTHMQKGGHSTYWRATPEVRFWRNGKPSGLLRVRENGRRAQASSTAGKSAQAPPGEQPQVNLSPPLRLLLACLLACLLGVWEDNTPGPWAYPTWHASACLSGPFRKLKLPVPCMSL